MPRKKIQNKWRRPSENTTASFKVDQDSKQHAGIDLKWHCALGTVPLSVDGCMEQALLELEHSAPGEPTHSPFRHDMPKHGKRVQFMKMNKPTE